MVCCLSRICVYSFELLLNLVPESVGSDTNFITAILKQTEEQAVVFSFLCFILPKQSPNISIVAVSVCCLCCIFCLPD